MSAKTKRAEEPQVTSDRILFDARESQTFNFSLSQRGREIPISHTVDPVSDARYFAMSEELEKVSERLKKITSEIFVPKEKIWDEHVHASTGYGDRSDWKEKVSQDDKIGVVNAYFEVEPDEEPASTDEGELIYDFDALTEIYFSCRFGSARLLGMVHKFREYTRSEKDEFLAIVANQPNPNELASAQRVSKVEKLARLGKKLLKETVGYAEGSDAPAWHLAATTEWYFLRELSRQGKS